MSQVFPYDQQLFEESAQRDYCHSLLRNDAQNEEQIYCVDASISMATANNTSSTATVLTGQTGGERGGRGGFAPTPSFWTAVPAVAAMLERVRK